MPLFIAILSFISIVCLGGAMVSLFGTRRRAVPRAAAKLTSRRSPAPRPASAWPMLARMGHHGSRGKKVSRPVHTGADAGGGQALQSVPRRRRSSWASRPLLLWRRLIVLLLAQARPNCPFSVAAPIIISWLDLCFPAQHVRHDPPAQLYRRRAATFARRRGFASRSVVSSGMTWMVAWNLVATKSGTSARACR